MAEMYYLLQKVMDARDDKLNEEELSALEQELSGALIGVSQTPQKQRLLDKIKNHEWAFLEGLLRHDIDEREAREGTINVSAVARASATATINLAMTIEAVDRGALPENEKTELKRDLVTAEGEARSGRLVGFAKAAVSACEKAGKCATSLTAVLTLLAELAKSIPTDGTNVERPI